MVDSYTTLAKWIMNYDHLVQTIDFEQFKLIVEEMRGFEVGTEYALGLWDMFHNPLELRRKLRGEFATFLRVAFHRTARDFGRHEDLVP